MDKKYSYRLTVMWILASICIAVVSPAFAQGEYDLHFNGDDTHVVVPHSPEFNFTGDFTIEAWINVEGLSENMQNRDIISKHQSHVSNQGTWIWVLMGPPNPVGQLKFIVWQGDETVCCETPANVILASGDHCSLWHHIAFVYNGNTHEWRQYVNGNEVSNGVTNLPIGQNALDLVIGWEHEESWGWHSFFGWMTEIRISDLPRYSSEFAPANPLGTDSNTIAYWSFDDGEGSVLTDQSGNGHHGTIHNGEWVPSCLPVPVDGSTWSAVKSLY